MIFETILTQAAQLAADKEAKAEALKEKRRLEVYGDAGKRKSYPRPPKKSKGVDRRNGHSALDPHKEYIISARSNGVTLKEIADHLYKFHEINISPTQISKYYITHTGHRIGQNRFAGVSVLDDHHDLLADCVARGLSYPAIAKELYDRGVKITSQAVGGCIRRLGLKYDR